VEVRPETLRFLTLGRFVHATADFRCKPFRDRRLVNQSATSPSNLRFSTTNAQTSVGPSDRAKLSDSGAFMPLGRSRGTRPVRSRRVARQTACPTSLCLAAEGGEAEG